MHLQWDKLFINNEVFVFSEETGSVELETEIHCNVSSKLKSRWLAVRKEKLKNYLVMGESPSIFHDLK